MLNARFAAGVPFEAWLGDQAWLFSRRSLPRFRYYCAVRANKCSTPATGDMDNPVKAYHAILLLTGTCSAFGHEHRVISQASDLVPWCKAEAEARYVARNVTPYNWTASYHERSNVLYVDGKLRVNGDDVAVRCRISSGAREEYATMEIDESNK